MNLSLEDMMNAVDADMCLDSLEHFVKEFWSVLEDIELKWNWHMSVICEEVQFVLERALNGLPTMYDPLIINVPPGSSKSTICSIMAPAWMWAKKPSSRSGCVSYAKDVSLDFSTKTRTIIESDRYKTLFPNVELKDDQNQKTNFATTKNGVRYATSIGGSATGKHWDAIFCDDPINPKQAGSSVVTQEANEFFGGTLSTRKRDKAVTPTIVIMQRLSVDDPTNHLVEKGFPKLRHICLPAELTDEVKPASLKNRYIDGLLDVKRMSRATLQEMKLAMGDRNYAGQMLQVPVAVGGNMFKTDQIEIVQAVKKDDIVSVWRAWDLAGAIPTRKSPDPDYTCGLKMGKMKDGSFIILDLVRGRWSAERRNNIILQTATMDGKRVKVKVEQEGGSGGLEQAQNLVRLLAGFSAIKEKPTGSKTQRADIFAAQVNIGNVKMVKAKWNKDLLDEMSSFPLARHDDITDACSSAFSSLNVQGKPQVRSL